MIAFGDSEKNSNYIYDLNYKFFNASGFGLLENPKKWQKKLYSTYHIIIHFTYVFLIAFCFVDAYLIWDDKVKLNLNLCVTITSAGSQAKIWALMLHMKNLSVIRKNFKDDFNLEFVSRNEKARKIKQETAEILVRLTKLLYMIAFPAAVIWITFPLVDPGTEERRWCIPFPLVRDKSSPGFEIIYTFHGIILVHFVSNIISNDVLIFGFLMRICDQLDILKINLEEIKDVYPKVDYGKFIEGYADFKNGDEITTAKHKKFYEDSDWRMAETRKLIRQNVVHHRRILRQFDLIKETYGVQLFIQITVGALVISVAAFDVILQSRKFNAPVIQQLLYVAGVTIDIFIMCYFGTQIQSKSEEVVQTLYDVPWHEMDTSNRKLLMFMIAKCQRPPILKAKYVFTVKLGTFQSLMRTSYNVMALLNEAR